MKKYLLPVPKAQYYTVKVTRVRELLAANPHRPNSHIEAEVGIGHQIVSRERLNLVRAGIIPDVGRRRIVKKKVTRGKPMWELPDRQLVRTTNMFDTFLEYCGEMLTEMPMECDNAFLAPANEQEIRMRWGFLETLRGIQKVTKELETKYSMPRLASSQKNE